MRRKVKSSEHTNYGNGSFLYNYILTLDCGHNQLWYSNSKRPPPKTTICLKCIKEKRESEANSL